MRFVLIIAALMLTACQPAPPPTAAEPNATSPHWDAHLLALLPQIDACIVASPDARWISYAGAHDGATLVRLSGETGAFDCRFDKGAAVVTPRDETLRVDSENAAIFVRGPGENPGGECYEAPEVRGANGELLGWMLDPEGC